MKKTNKLIILLVIAILMSFIFASIVKASDVINIASIDENGYEELEEEPEDKTEEGKKEETENKVEEEKKEETEKTPEVIEDEEDNKKDDKEDAKNDNKEETGKGEANTNHAQTGEFTSAIFMSCIAFGIITMLIAYRKNKKYNY